MGVKHHLRKFELLSKSQLELLAFAALGLFHLSYVFCVSTPLIHADEAGHLLQAAALAGYSTHGPNVYGVGFPSLIFPLFILFDNPETIYRFVLIVNAGLATLTAWIVYQFLRIWSESSLGWRKSLLVAIAAALYPASFAYTTSAQAETLFAATFAGLLLANFSLAQSSNQRWWPIIWSAVLTGILTLIHLRGAPTAVLSCLFVTYLLLRARNGGALAIWYSISASLYVGGMLMANAIQNRLMLGSFSNSGESSAPSYNTWSKLSMFSSYEDFLAGFGTLIVTGSGQLSYLVAATLGLLVIAVWAIGKRAMSSKATAAKMFCVFVLIVLAANLAMSVVTHFHGSRIDHFVYGRYNEALLSIFLAIGLSEINRPRARVSLLVFWASLAILIWIFVALQDDELSPANLHNVMGLFWLLALFQQIDNELVLQIWIWAAIICLLVATSIALLINRGSGFVLLVAVTFFLQSTLLAVLFLSPSSNGRDSQRLIAEYVRSNIDSGACITQHLAKNFSAWSHWNTKFYLFNYQLREERHIHSGQICGSWVISADKDLKYSNPGAVLVVRENQHPQALWHLGPVPTRSSLPTE